MKGVVFTEFLEMVEEAHGLVVVDRVIEGAALESGGVYTSVGTYDHTELLALVTNLAAEVKVPIPDLVRAYGEHLFGVFKKGHPAFFEGVSSAFDFLSQVDNHIHVEVRKLYPGAELPTFTAEFPKAGTMELTYQSPRPLADFARGLIDGCVSEFGEEIDISREDVECGTRFVLKIREPMPCPKN
ncbi:MAG: hypothetical protein ACI8QS_003160 [Planctomycetota bacterium]|jgi:hypothetical protein